MEQIAQGPSQEKGTPQREETLHPALCRDETGQGCSWQLPHVQVYQAGSFLTLHRQQALHSSVLVPGLLPFCLCVSPVPYKDTGQGMEGPTG